MYETEKTSQLLDDGKGQRSPFEKEGEELKRIDLSNAEVIRCELMTKQREMQVTIRPDGIQFNQNCINRLEDYTHIQILVDSERRLLVVRPCDADDKDSQKWTTPKGKSRRIIGRDFGVKFFGKFDWCRGYCYKICGSPALQLNVEDRLLLAFELDECEAFPLTAKARKKAGVTDEELGEEVVAELDRLETLEIQQKEQARLLGRGTPKKQTIQPESWADGFGEKFSEHVDRIDVNTFHLERTEVEEKKAEPEPKEDETVVASSQQELFTGTTATIPALTQSFRNFLNVGQRT